MDDDGKDRPRLPWGAYSAIARRLRPAVSPQSVKDVYLGRTTSARISRAIDNYIARMQRAEAKKAVA